MRQKYLIRMNIFPLLLGAAVVSMFATLQNLFITGIHLHPQHYIIPVIVGGLSGFFIGRAYSKLQTTVDELRDQNRKIQEQSEELQAKEEMLQRQIKVYGETHAQLMATKSSLRAQIDEFEINQKLLRDSNSALQALFDVSPLAIAVTSYNDGTLRETNQRFADDFGYPREESVGKTCLNLGLWVDQDCRELIQKLVHDQHSLQGFPIEIRTYQKEKRNILLYRNLVDYKGEKCMLMVFLDVTEQKKLEEQLRQTQKMEVVGQLAGGIAHDFNNMLTGIMGAAELLKNYLIEEPKLVKLATIIVDTAARSADLTKKLLTFSRKGKNVTTQVSINDLISVVISLLERTIDKKIRIETRLSATNPVVSGDAALLQNALLNLAVNSRDAMPEGGTLTIGTANTELDSVYCNSQAFKLTPGRYLEITFTDTGFGMTKEVVEHMFEPFFTTKEVGKGTGLGLSAVYGTVKDHLGSINVYSEPGTGTIIKIYLPSADGDTVMDTCDVEVPKGTGGILLVDDEQVIRDIARAMLEELGYTVYLAEDGRQALEVYAREREAIRLVILDMVMPNLNGKETIIQLKQLDPEVKVLISSGFHKEKADDLLNDFGAKGFIQKPYRRNELCRALAETITT